MPNWAEEYDEPPCSCGCEDEDWDNNPSVDHLTYGYGRTGKYATRLPGDRIEYSDVNGGYSITFDVVKTWDGPTLVPGCVSRDTDFVALREAVSFCLDFLKG